MKSQLETRVTVVGAGVLGLWQAFACARAGFRVRLVDKNCLSGRGPDFEENASVLAGGMLAPDCEGEAAPEVVRDMGRVGVDLWRELVPCVTGSGSLVIAGTRDQEELVRYAKMTSGFERVDGAALKILEPALEGRYSAGLHFGGEAHVVVPDAISFLLGELVRLGVELFSGETFHAGSVNQDDGDDVVIDCRGLAARDDPISGTGEVLSRLRGVRGERIVIQTEDVNLNRPVRLLHPRYPIYVVPWDKGRFVVGATVIESEDRGGASVRSVLELLGSAFSLHPSFGEASIVNIGAGVRPAFPDNVPRAVIVRSGAQRAAPGARVICVNGAYRHGFLLAPVLAEAVCQYLCSGESTHPLVVEAGL